MKNKPRPGVLFAAAMIGSAVDIRDRDSFVRTNDAMWRIWNTMTKDEKQIHVMTQLT